MPKCFKCEKDIESATSFGKDSEEETWECPSGAVAFEGGSNFGSTLYDSMIDGIYVQILVCDQCLNKAQHDPELLREIRIKTRPAERIPVEKKNIP